MAYTDWKKEHYNSQSVFNCYIRSLVLRLLDMVGHNTEFKVVWKKENVLDQNQFLPPKLLKFFHAVTTYQLPTKLQELICSKLCVEIKVKQN